MKCVEDIREDLYAMVGLPDGVAMFQETGEQMAKECNVSYAKEFFSVTVSVEVSMGHKVGPAERKRQNAHRLAHCYNPAH